jgi:hypothetical protein
MKFYTKEKHNQLVAKGEARLGQQHFIGHGVVEPHKEECGVQGCMICFNAGLDRILAMQQVAVGPVVVVSEVDWQG